ncbi:unnamed protein product, partial [Ectocarpus sp. 13 AM-2016]
PLPRRETRTRLPPAVCGRRLPSPAAAAALLWGTGNGLCRPRRVRRSFGLVVAKVAAAGNGVHRQEKRLRVSQELLRKGHRRRGVSVRQRGALDGRFCGENAPQRRGRIVVASTIECGRVEGCPAVGWGG